MAIKENSFTQDDRSDGEKKELHQAVDTASHTHSPNSQSSTFVERKEADGDYKNLHLQSTSQPSVQEKGVDPEQKQFYDDFAARDNQWHARIERRLLVKVDLHLLPLLVIMYLLNFLDRKYVPPHVFLAFASSHCPAGIISSKVFRANGWIFFQLL